MKFSRCIVLALSLAGLSSARAQPRMKLPPEPIIDAEIKDSAQLQELVRKVKAGDAAALPAFWKARAAAGGPLVEPLTDMPHFALVTFVYRSAHAKSVTLLRSGDMMQPSAPLTRLAGTDVWARSYRLRDDARIGYAFGPDLPPSARPDFAALRWQIRADPYNSRRLDVTTSLLVMPNAPPQSLTVPSPSLPAGAVRVHRLTSKTLGNSRNVYVYTPPGFDPKGAPYPLLVLFDGFSYFSSIPTATIVDNLIAQKRLPPTVVVAIEPVARMAELGLGDAFADVVAGEIVPWMEQRYHATSDPRAIVVGGYSLGGLQSAWCAYRHPEVFGNVLSQSGSFWWPQPGDDEYEWLARRIAETPRRPIRFYLDAGRLEGRSPNASPAMLPVNLHLRDVLVAKGYPVSLRIVSAEHHPSNWRVTLGDALAGLIGDVEPRRTPARKPTPDLKVEDLGDSAAVAVLRAAALGGTDAVVRALRELPSTNDLDEGTFNQVGYELMYSLEQVPAAVAVFDEATTRFPKSSNAFDSLGEAYFVAGDKARAISSYKKALALDPRNDNASGMLKMNQD